MSILFFNLNISGCWSAFVFGQQNQIINVWRWPKCKTDRESPHSSGLTECWTTMEMLECIPPASRKLEWDRAKGGDSLPDCIPDDPAADPAQSPSTQSGPAISAAARQPSFCAPAEELKRNAKVLPVQRGCHGEQQTLPHQALHLWSTWKQQTFSLMMWKKASKMFLWID